MMPHVVVVGSPHPELQTYLQTAGYTYSQHASFSEYTQVLTPDQPPAPVVVHGGDATLESPDGLLNLLNTHAILVLFSPTPTLVENLRQTLKSVVDLASLGLPANVPLIVHKIRELDHFRYIPGFATDGGSQTPNDAHLIEFSVKLIQDSISYASDSDVIRTLADDNLVPPAGTNFWFQPATYSFTSTSLPTLNFNSSLYVYATSARPDKPDFSGNGGVVYILAKHSGRFPYPAPFYDILLHVGGTNTSSPVLQNDDHQPKSFSSQDGSGNYTYKIDFSRTLNLWRSKGNESFQHTITSKDEWSFNGLVQSYEQPSSSQYNIRLAAETFAEGRPGNLHGLSVWKTSNMGKATFRLGCTHKGTTQSKSWDLDLKFESYPDT